MQRPAQASEHMDPDQRQYGQTGKRDQSRVRTHDVAAPADHEHGRAPERDDALLYLAGDNFRIDCAILGLRAERVLALLQPPAAADEPDSDPKLTDDQVRAAYTRYTQANDLTLRDLARQYDTTAATLSRRFARLQLTARPNRRHRPGAAVPAAAVPGAAVPAATCPKHRIAQ